MSDWAFTGLLLVGSIAGMWLVARLAGWADARRSKDDERWDWQHR